jgi:hypothetical protein
MRIINYAIKNAVLAGMVLALSAGPALAFGDIKVANEKPKVEINKVEKAMIEAKKVEEQPVMKPKANSDLGVLRINLLGEGILGEEGIILGEEGILGEGLLGIGE